MIKCENDQERVSHKKFSVLPLPLGPCFLFQNRLGSLLQITNTNTPETTEYVKV